MNRRLQKSLFCCLLSCLFLCLVTAPAQALPEDTWVVSIGNNRGDASDIELLYAERDAQEMANVLRSQGNVPSDRVRLLVNESADTVRRVLLEVNTALRARGAVDAEGGRRSSALVVFYSGHADAEALHLRGTHLPLEEIRGATVISPAKVRLLVVDACRSGTVTRVKGMQPAPEFTIQLDSRIEVEGTALIASSTANESSQESDRLRGSFFSHHLVNALRGAADRNGDGVVTLSEAYEYAHKQTLRSSGQTLQVQHPTYAYDVKGSGELVLTSVTMPGNGGSRLRLPKAGTYLITDEHETGAVVAEFTTTRDRALISLPHGRYFVQRRGALEYREYQLALPPGQEVDLERLPYRSVGYDRLVRKRGGARKSVHAVMALFGARGEVLQGEGVTPNLVLGYNADLPWLSIAARLRGDTAAWNAVDGFLPRRRYELGLQLVVQRYIDLPWFSFAFGISVEGFFAAQRFHSQQRTATPRNTLGMNFSALLALERRLYSGLSLRIEGGPLALIDRRATSMNGEETAATLGSVFTYWVTGGVIWRL